MFVIIIYLQDSIDKDRVEALLDYLTSVINSSHSKGHLSTSVICTLWRHVTLLAGRIGATPYITAVVSSLFSYADLPTLTACFKDLHCSMYLQVSAGITYDQTRGEGSV